VLAFVLLAGCGSAEQRYCKLGASQVVAATQSKVIDGIALSEWQGGALFVWSDSYGTFARVLDARGTPIRDVVRLVERCDGGLALASSTTFGVALACGRRSVPRAIGSEGEVLVYGLDSSAKRLKASERALRLGQARLAPRGGGARGLVRRRQVGEQGSDLRKGRYGHGRVSSIDGCC